MYAHLLRRSRTLSSPHSSNSKYATRHGFQWKHPHIFVTFLCHMDASISLAFEHHLELEHSCGTCYSRVEPSPAKLNVTDITHSLPWCQLNKQSVCLINTLNTRTKSHIYAQTSRVVIDKSENFHSGSPAEINATLLEPLIAEACSKRATFASPVTHTSTSSVANPVKLCNPKPNWCFHNKSKNKDVFQKQKGPFQAET